MTHIVHPKIIEGLSNLNLLFCIEEGIGKLFPFSQSTLDNLKSRDVTQEVPHRLVWIASLVRVRILLGMHSCEAGVS